jgi:hypothetical protein
MPEEPFDEAVKARLKPILEKIRHLQITAANYLQGVIDAKGLVGYRADISSMKFVKEDTDER